MFLDEPTSELDIQSNQIILGVILDLIFNDVSVFLMAHNIEEAKVMCNLIVIINERNIVASYTQSKKDYPWYTIASNLI